MTEKEMVTGYTVMTLCVVRNISYRVSSIKDCCVKELHGTLQQQLLLHAMDSTGILQICSEK